MPLLFTCCSLPSTAKNNTLQIPTNPTLLFTSSSDASSSSSLPSTSSTVSTSDDTLSLQTFPSLPSLQSLLPTSLTSLTSPLSSSTSFLCLSSLTNSLHSSPTALAFSSSLLLYSASESQISVFDLTSLTQIDSFPAPCNAGSIKSVSFSPNGKIFTAHQDGRIRVWNRSAQSNRHRLITSLPTVNDRLLRLPLPSNYVTVRRHKKRLWIEHVDTVSAVATRNDLLYSVSWDKSLKIWRASDLRCLESITAHEDAINAVAVSPDGTIYTGSADRRIRVWGKGVGERRHSLIATLEKHKSAVNALAIGEDGSVLYSGACDRSILVWEREDSANHMVVSGALRGHRRAILCLAYAGELLFSGSSDRTVRIWRKGGDDGGYSCLVVMEGHARGVRSLAAFRVTESEEGQEYRVCSGSLDGEVRVWQVLVSNLKASDSS